VNKDKRKGRGCCAPVPNVLLLPMSAWPCHVDAAIVRVRRLISLDI
jgi:hypothetical protein